MEQQRVVAKRCVDGGVDRHPGSGEPRRVIAHAEQAISARSRWPVVVQGAERLSIDVEVAITTAEVLVLRVVAIQPLRDPVLAPDLDVAVVVGAGHDAVIAHLTPGVGLSRQLRLLRPRIGLLVDGVVVGGQAKAIDLPAPKDIAPVGRSDVRWGSVL